MKQIKCGKYESKPKKNSVQESIDIKMTLAEILMKLGEVIDRLDKLEKKPKKKSK